MKYITHYVVCRLHDYTFNALEIRKRLSDYIIEINKCVCVYAGGLFHCERKKLQDFANKST